MTGDTHDVCSGAVCFYIYKKEGKRGTAKATANSSKPVRKFVLRTQSTHHSQDAGLSSSLKICQNSRTPVGSVTVSKQSA